MLDDVLGKGWPLCSQTDPEIFFAEPSQPSERTNAQALCETCSVRIECLAACFDSDSVYGIWGGILQSQREKYHVEFHRTRPDSKEFAAKVIREIDELYGTPSQHAEARAVRRRQSKERMRAKDREALKRESPLWERWSRAS